MQDIKEKNNIDEILQLAKHIASSPNIYSLINDKLHKNSFYNLEDEKRMLLDIILKNFEINESKRDLLEQNFTLISVLIQESLEKESILKDEIQYLEKEINKESIFNRKKTEKTYLKNLLIIREEAFESIKKSLDISLKIFVNEDLLSSTIFTNNLLTLCFKIEKEKLSKLIKEYGEENVFMLDPEGTGGRILANRFIKDKNEINNAIRYVNNENRILIIKSLEILDNIFKKNEISFFKSIKLFLRNLFDKKILENESDISEKIPLSMLEKTSLGILAENLTELIKTSTKQLFIEDIAITLKNSEEEAKIYIKQALSSKGQPKNTINMKNFPQRIKEIRSMIFSRE